MKSLKRVVITNSGFEDLQTNGRSTKREKKNDLRTKPIKKHSNQQPKPISRPLCQWELNAHIVEEVTDAFARAINQ